MPSLRPSFDLQPAVTPVKRSENEYQTSSIFVDPRWLTPASYQRKAIRAGGIINTNLSHNPMSFPIFLLSLCFFSHAPSWRTRASLQYDSHLDINVREEEDDCGEAGKARIAQFYMYTFVKDVRWKRMERKKKAGERDRKNKISRPSLCLFFSLSSDSSSGCPLSCHFHDHDLSLVRFPPLTSIDFGRVLEHKSPEQIK